MQENSRLRALLSGMKQGNKLGQRGPSGRSEKAERLLFEQIGRSSRPRTVLTEQDIVMPSREFSGTVVRHAFQWTFWVHYALFTPEFDKGHDEFWERFSTNRSLAGIDMFWLATYFSVLASNLLSMDEDETAPLRPHDVSFIDLLRNWYEAALLFLEKADFTQNPNINAIRAIAILGIVFNNVGDTNRYVALWPVAIQQAQQLEMGTDAAHLHETYVQQQMRRRLWWTLVLCDWLPIPYRIPSINDIDFDCQLPDEVDDEELASGSPLSRLSRSKPRPISYHLTMIKISKIYYQIRYKLRLRRWSPAEVAEFVFAADEQLAHLISELPPHLQFEEVSTDATKERDRRYPFILWQKENLSKILLYYRMAISRLSNEHGRDGSVMVARARAICLSSAKGLVNCTLSHATESSKARPW